MDDGDESHSSASKCSAIASTGDHVTAGALALIKALRASFVLGHIISGCLSHIPSETQDLDKAATVVTSVDTGLWEKEEISNG